MSATQINYARELIEKSNPLRQTKLTQVWPCCFFCCSCCLDKRKRTFRNGLKRSMRLKLGIPNLHSDVVIEKNPFLLLGFGINSYFQIMLQLMYFMLLISCLAIPMMYYFSTFNGTKGQVGYYFSQFSLGNIGGAKTYCIQAPYDEEQSSMIL